ncbi:ABC transporter ATP-binding protein [Vibrio sp. CDRSL-10 TSBA]
MNKRKCILDIKDLSIKIDGSELVSDISLQLYEGERVCLLGASGSGKSLTAKAISGTLAPYCKVEGNIHFNGELVTTLPVLGRPSNARVATVFQDTFSALNPLMSVGKQLALSTNIHTQQALLPLLKQMQLIPADDSEQSTVEDKALLNRLPSELSGGQRQRLCIAFALLSGSNLLVADEPTTALDVINQKQVIELLQQCCGEDACQHPEQLHSRRLSLLFITHDINVAAQLCERGIVMHNGRIVEAGTMHQLLTQPEHEYTRSLVRAANQVIDWNDQFTSEVKSA